MEIQDVLAMPEYAFFREDSVFSTRPVMFVTLSGSLAYGTSTPYSDIDIRGCMLAAKSDLLGLTSYKGYAHEGTDTYLYASQHFIGLCLDCNPAVLELLGCRPEEYALVSPAGRLLLDNYRVFLSQKVIDSFGEYANQQLIRLQNALAHDRMGEAAQAKHLKEAFERTLDGAKKRYSVFPNGSISFRIGESEKTGYDSELFADISLEHYPVRDFASLVSDLSTLSKNFSKLNNRNKKKDIPHLAKHMMHLLRLYYMLYDLLEREEIITYRAEEHDLLMEVRNGSYMTVDGLVRPEFYDILNDIKGKCNEAAKNTGLPKDPDIAKANDLAMAIHELAVLPGTQRS